MPADQIQVQFLAELSKTIAEYTFFRRTDQLIVFGTVWLSIFSSTAAALLTAIGKGKKTTISVLAAIPAICLTINSMFNFPHQYQLRKSATAALIELQDQIKYQNLTIPEASEKKMIIIKNLEEQSVIPRLSNDTITNEDTGYRGRP